VEVIYLSLSSRVRSGRDTLFYVEKIGDEEILEEEDQTAWQGE
jgi:hypothetical protein